MSKAAVAVVAAALLALTVTVVFVPARWGVRLAGSPEPREVAQVLRWYEDQAARESEADRRFYAAEHLEVVGLLAGETIYDVADDELSWTWHWRCEAGAVVLRPGGGELRFECEAGQYIQWPIVFAEQALILLLGGGLLTWVVRRKRAAA